MNLEGLTSYCLVCASDELIEDVVIAFVGSLEDDSRFLQKIPFNVCTYNITLIIEFNANEFSLPLVTLFIGLTNREELLFLTV